MKSDFSEQEFLEFVELVYKNRIKNEELGIDMDYVIREDLDKGEKE